MTRGVDRISPQEPADPSRLFPLNPTQCSAGCYGEGRGTQHNSAFTSTDEANT
jgi:hypothetical protein